MRKKKVKVSYKTNGYDRVKNGKKEHVKKYEKKINVPEVSLSMRQVITQEEATRLFNERSDISQKVDIQQEANYMFAVPNKYWANFINRADLWGLDGFNPPVILNKPTKGYPYQVVKYDDTVYVADERGLFKPELLIRELHPMKEENIAKFETETNKKAIWNEKITKQYQKWLDKERQLINIANKLDLDDPKNKLFKISELYNSLKLSEKDLKKVFIDLHNKHYAQEAQSYTQSVEKYHKGGFEAYMNRIESAEEKRLAKSRITPQQRKAAKDRYNKSWFKTLNVLRVINSMGWWGVNPEGVHMHTMTLPGEEAGDIATDFINQYVGSMEMDVAYFVERYEELTPKQIAEQQKEIDELNWMAERNFYEEELGMTNEEAIELEKSVGRDLDKYLIKLRSLTLKEAVV